MSAGERIDTKQHVCLSKFFGGGLGGALAVLRCSQLLPLATIEELVDVHRVLAPFRDERLLKRDAHQQALR